MNIIDTNSDKQAELQNSIPTYQDAYLNPVENKDPCKNCPNNPKNNPNASGVCNCALPYFANPIR